MMQMWLGAGKNVPLFLALAVAFNWVSVCAFASNVDFSRRDPITAHLSVPNAVAVDVWGNIFVAEASHNQIDMFDAQGAHRGALSGLDKPISLAIDRSARIFVGNAGRGNVEIYNPELTLSGKLGVGDREFGQPSGIAIDGAGFVYVADSRENLVKVYHPDGTLKSVIGDGATAGTRLQFPTALAVNDTTGEIVVTDLGDILLSRGALASARIMVFSSSGAFLRSFGYFGRGEGLLVKPLGVAIDGEGKIYVTDAYQNVVQVFGRSGSYLGTIHDPGHPLRTPLGIAFSAVTNSLYVCSLTAGRIESFDVAPPEQYGELTVSSVGDGEGTVTSTPAGIACPGACSALFPVGITVTLTAEAGSWSTFAGWADACVGAGSCVVEMTRELNATARFDAAAATRRAPSDFNGDGISDVLWIDNDRHQASIWLIDRDLRPHASPVAAAYRQRVGGVGDVSGDGKADILWNSTRRAVTLWSMDGATIAETVGWDASTAPGWEIVGVSDFDGDGRADILWRHAGKGSLLYWSITDNVVSAVRTIATVKDLKWQIAGLADFDGDGCSDILWRNTRTGEVRIWYMIGSELRRSVKPDRSPDRGADSAGCGDFDGDGHADILWRAKGGNLSYWSFQADDAVEVASLANSPEDRWRVLNSGDYNGDGRADLLLRLRAGDTVGVCLTEDTTTLRCVTVGTAPGSARAERGSAP